MDIKHHNSNQILGYFLLLPLSVLYSWECRDQISGHYIKNTTEVNIKYKYSPNIKHYNRPIIVQYVFKVSPFVNNNNTTTITTTTTTTSTTSTTTNNNNINNNNSKRIKHFILF